MTKQLKPFFCALTSALILFATLSPATSLHAQVANRLTSPVDSSKLRPLANHHPQWAIPQNLAHPVASDMTLGSLTMVLSRSPQQEQELQKLLSDQQNRQSPDYHHWLTPAEMGERFGLSAQDLDAVTEWLKSQGLHVTWVAPSRTLIGFSGTAASVGTAFHTEMRYYNVGGRQLMSVSSDPMIPEALAPVIQAIRGLYTIEEHPLSHSALKSMDSPYVSLQGGTNLLGPADFATIYDIPSNVTGSGITIGIVGRSRTDFNDFANFQNLFGISFNNPTEVIPTAFGGVDPGPALTAPPTGGQSSGDQGEATLDVLRTGSTAQSANLLLVVATNSSGGIGADAEYLVETSPVPAQIMSISFGGCEGNAGPAGVSFWDKLFQQAAAEGISVFVSSGDSGASVCDAAFTAPPANPSPNSPNYICSSSYATCVGGTEFNDFSNPSAYWNPFNGAGLGSALGYIPEGAWNEPVNTNTTTTQVASSGGGVSSVIPTPTWQTGAGVPAARAGRYTPDIAFSASGHDGYLACFAAGGADCVQSLTVFSGTSAAAPGMAGITALLDQSKGGPQGSLNPELYQLAAGQPSVFHDVTVSSSGVANCAVTTSSMCNNSIPGPSSLTSPDPGYLVGNGYDEVTGLGSLDVSVFLTNFSTTSPTASGLQFVPITPCRVVDTRNPAGPFGGPALAAQTPREFDIPQGGCNIPSSAVAYSLNLTAVPSGTLDYLTLWPSGQTQPVVSTLNSLDGRVKANAAITPAGSNGGVTVFGYDSTHVILDINGYFVPAGTPSALAFYPVTPCRVADTRSAAGALGGPYMPANTSRAFPVLSSSCGLPSTAQAYSMNVTAVPHHILDYLTIWPTGQAQPVVSTLNATTGTVTANAAIVPAASGGDISVFVSNDADVVLDVNGYFAPPTTGGLSLYTTTPCRALDTRPIPFTQTTVVSIQGSVCAPPTNAEAYVLNATALPAGVLDYLSLWPSGQSQPVVSTLNAVDGSITSNMAIVPTNDGAIDAYAAGTTNLLLDLSSYFAP